MATYPTLPGNPYAGLYRTMAARQRRGNPGVWGTAGAGARRGNLVNAAAGIASRFYNSGNGGSSATPNYQTPQYGGAAPSFSWENDPALIAAKLVAGKDKASAEADRNDQWRKIVLQAGLSDVAQKLFPKDAAFIASVKNNPFSYLADIANTYDGRSGRINQANEQANADNLWFSSYRTGSLLPQLQRERAQSEYDVTTQSQNAVDDVNRAYTQRVAEIEWQMQQAALLAQQNALLNALNSGGGGGGGSTAPPNTSDGQSQPTTNNDPFGGGRNYAGQYVGQVYKGMTWNGTRWV